MSTTYIYKEIKISFFEIVGPTPGINLNSIASPIPTLATADPLSHLYHNYTHYGLCKFSTFIYRFCFCFYWLCIKL